MFQKKNRTPGMTMQVRKRRQWAFGWFYAGTKGRWRHGQSWHRHAREDNRSHGLLHLFFGVFEKVKKKSAKMTKLIKNRTRHSWAQFDRQLGHTLILVVSLSFARRALFLLDYTQRITTLSGVLASLLSSECTFVFSLTHYWQSAAHTHHVVVDVGKVNIRFYWRV